MLHTVATHDQTLSAEVGWELSLGSYWFYVTDAAGNRVASGGLDAEDEPEEIRRLVTLYDLVEASAGIIDWFKEDVVLRQLRDPWAEQVKLVPRDTPAARLLTQTFG
jgi:hypothetical protein